MRELSETWAAPPRSAGRPKALSSGETVGGKSGNGIQNLLYTARFSVYSQASSAGATYTASFDGGTSRREEGLASIYSRPARSLTSEERIESEEGRHASKIERKYCFASRDTGRKDM